MKPILPFLHTSKQLVKENPTYFMIKNTKENDITTKLPKDTCQENVPIEQMKIVTQHFTTH